MVNELILNVVLGLTYILYPYEVKDFHQKKQVGWVIVALVCIVSLFNAALVIHLIKPRIFPCFKIVLKSRRASIMSEETIKPMSPEKGDLANNSQYVGPG